MRRAAGAAGPRRAHGGKGRGARRGRRAAEAGRRGATCLRGRCQTGRAARRLCRRARGLPPAFLPSLRARGIPGPSGEKAGSERLRTGQAALPGDVLAACPGSGGGGGSAGLFPGWEEAGAWQEHGSGRPGSPLCRVRSDSSQHSCGVPA